MINVINLNVKKLFHIFDFKYTKNVNSMAINQERIRQRVVTIIVITIIVVSQSTFILIVSPVQGD